MDSLKDVFQRLSAASSKYRSAPFWAWNDSLNPERLSEQIDLMKQQGFGGFFIHSREGLETEYLSKEWMDCAEAAVEHAEQSGMECWIYDEDTWPSGSAGGAVSAADPEHYSAKGLTIELNKSADLSLSTLNDDKSIIAVYRLEYESGNGRLRAFTLLADYSELQKPGESADILICRVEVSGPSEWYNGFAPTDNLNPEAVRCFIEKTHETYASRFGEKFGTIIRGFFTDEPNICDFFAAFTTGRPWLPWGDELPRAFEENRESPFYECIPLLFFNGPGSEKARYDYWYTLTEMFVSSYTRQLYDWCEERNLRLTGHMLYENDLGYGVRCNGAVMPHYRYMHAPGIDLLGDQRREYLTVKQCTSVANQFGKDGVVSEMYGCTGWEFSFAGQKRLGDWQFILGVTRRCQHLALYSITGCRKRDYPPVFNYQSPWWGYANLLEDYFSRLGICTTSGEVCRDILMIHPIGSFWIKSGSSADEDLSKIYMNMGWLDEHIMGLNRDGDYYNRLTEQLLRLQFDFDFGDEIIMRDSASASGGKLQVGLHRYSFVIVPPVETLMASTVRLLQDFLVSGGHVFWMSPFPSMVDAELSDEIDMLVRHEDVHVAQNFTELISLLSSMVERPVRICDSYGSDIAEMLSMTRQTENGRIITVVNTAAESQDDMVLTFPGCGRLTVLDLLSGKQSAETVFLTASGEMQLRTSFEAEETKVYFIDMDGEPDTVGSLPAVYRHPHDAVELVYAFPPEAPVELTTENGLTLDRCSYCLGDGAWSEELPVWQAQKQIRERFGMQAVYYNGGPQRYLWLGDKKSYPLNLRFSFDADILPEGESFAVVEKSNNMSISCNGTPCNPTGDWFIDHDFDKHLIQSLKTGENIIEIALDYTSAVELEDIFIIGAFGVNPERCITALPTRLYRGDWSLQGLKHYPGSCIYRYKIPKLELAGEAGNLMLRLGDFRGALAVIRIGSAEPIHALRETSVPVGGLIEPDTETEVEIEIVGSLRNLLGPLHRSANVCSRISWEDFHPSGAAYTPEYVTEPMGLIGEVYLFSAKQK